MFFPEDINMADTEYPDSPRVGVAVLVRKKEKILVILRGKQPGKCCWALPGGSMELGESMAQAGERELLEETGVHTRIQRVITAVDAVYRDPDGTIRYHYIIIYLEGRYISGEPMAMDDVLDAAWLNIEELELLPTEPNTLAIIKKAFMETAA
ncbi:MAG TPA: NUDIX domain-containing protein [Thermodesulfobacteriaceae bacterium]|nr:NUDIX domain-containing protein [Thermodesulfobacteriaceae bacterium]